MLERNRRMASGSLTKSTPCNFAVISAGVHGLRKPPCRKRRKRIEALEISFSWFAHFFASFCKISGPFVGGGAGGAALTTRELKAQ
jgi:hypothetical protein